MESATFDIVANVPRGATRGQASLMLQNMLADRFQLKLRRSTREVPIYALRVASSGPKLRDAANDANAPKPRGTMSAPGGGKRFEFNGITMAEFAGVLEHDVDRPVIDMTGLAGPYDIRLTFAPRRPFGPTGVSSPTPSPDMPEVFTALTEQLGLRLESRRGPIVVLVVDSALRQPTEN
jgi:uncharacterized protein (TIGR03435 family)